HTGHYAGKHPPDTRVAAEITEAVQADLVQGGITCAKAHAIAERMGVPPLQVGIAVDLLEERIGQCQMGLFGHDRDQKRVRPAPSVSPQLKTAVEKALQDERLPCASAWRIAKDFQMTRQAVADACEALKIRIKPCQLGAF
ncbi:MAG: hypothetical protein HKP58_01120, partial [Desulfatitalea sp.]|nr:hypothetical protein [Desulfatitalea sp.]NNJ98987.1 hypothetical protein [Desulfatitalea sp.]